MHSRYFSLATGSWPGLSTSLCLNTPLLIEQESKTLHHHYAWKPRDEGLDMKLHRRWKKLRAGDAIWRRGTAGV